MNQPLEITGKLLKRNWLLNLAGQVLPLLVAVASMPYVVHGLGAEQFGILSIAWTLLGFCGFLDLGLGRATTKFVAEALGKGDVGKLPGIVWTSLWSQVMFGVAGAALAALLIPVLVNHFLKVSPGLVSDTRICFFMLAAALPMVIAGNAIRGVLEAAQHFDVVNYVRVPANASMFLVPALALPGRLHLPGIVALMVMVRLLTLLIYLAACLRLFPVLRHSCVFQSDKLRALLVFGGWITVSNLVGPVLVYVDRFLIAAIISVTALGYYTVPYEAITRAWVLPASLAVTIFPAFSSLDALGSARRMQDLCVRSLKSILLALGPLLLLVIAFAHPLLQLWVGGEFAERSTLVLQILAVGVFVNSLAQIAFSLLQGLGRPDLVAKFHVAELPCHALLLWFLLKGMGIPGAALAWSLRVSVDAILLFGAVFWLKLVSVPSLIDNGLRKAAIGVALFGVLLALLYLLSPPTGMRDLAIAGLVLSFAVATWSYLLDAREREFVISTAAGFRLAWARAK